MLKNKNVVITGCNRGIGQKILEVFAQNGASIFACCRTEDEEFGRCVENIKNKYNVPVYIVKIDLSDSVSIKEAVKSIFKINKKIDVLVNNAGVSYDALLSMTSMDKTRKLFDINCFGMLELTNYISKAMIRNKSGNIINISSYIGLDGNRGQVAYSASKAAVVGITKSLALELSQYNIRVNAIAPGIIKTDMTSNIPDEEKEKIIESTCMKRMGEAVEVANAALFLASNLSSYITNQVLRVDGGIR